MSITLTQLRSEIEIIKKRTGKYPKKIYLDKEEFERYTDIIVSPHIHFQRKIKRDGKGIYFNGIRVERKD